MFGYVQNDMPANWVDKINGWIEELSGTNNDTTISWTKEEILKKDVSFTLVDKYYSKHKRLSLNYLLIRHYFIPLFK
ncbi:hypothetical protein AGMMS49525_10840 [Bacteroidia bacterium]|nr:hypothetical protein AGMMS49525_10840 [Bacteroidia bacterium]